MANNGRNSKRIGGAALDHSGSRLGGDNVAASSPGETMFNVRHLLPLAALAAVLSYAVPSSAETIIDEWAKVQVPSPPELKSSEDQRDSSSA